MEPDYDDPDWDPNWDEDDERPSKRQRRCYIKTSYPTFLPTWWDIVNRYQIALKTHLDLWIEDNTYGGHYDEDDFDDELIRYEQQYFTHETMIIRTNPFNMGQ